MQSAIGVLSARAASWWRGPATGHSFPHRLGKAAATLALFPFLALGWLAGWIETSARAVAGALVFGYRKGKKL